MLSVSSTHIWLYYPSLSLIGWSLIYLSPSVPASHCTAGSHVRDGLHAPSAPWHLNHLHSQCLDLNSPRLLLRRPQSLTYIKKVINVLYNVSWTFMDGSETAGDPLRSTMKEKLLTASCWAQIGMNREEEAELHVSDSCHVVDAHEYEIIPLKALRHMDKNRSSFLKDRYSVSTPTLKALSRFITGGY